MGAGGASEYNDVLAAAEFLKTRADVDPNRLGLWGGSYGGYLTALGLARNSDIFKAGVDLHGVHDWHHWTLGERDDHPLYVLDTPADELATALAASYREAANQPLALARCCSSRAMMTTMCRFPETVRLAGSAACAGAYRLLGIGVPRREHTWLLAP